MIRMGVVGCGSVVQQYHLPALAGMNDVALAGLADVNPAVLEQARSKWPVGQAVADYRELKDLDAVVVASPHSLHASMCEHFLERGIHVLVEKPMATRADDAEKLVALAADRKAVFAVGVFRRYYPTSVLIRSMIQRDWMGGVVEIDAEEGGPYDWELQSRFLLDRRMAGGGVLIDTGSHMLDRLLWWFPGAEVRLERYLDDSEHGVEADAELGMTLCWRKREVGCRVVLSRTRSLRNTIRMRFRDGWIEMGSNVSNGFDWSAEGLAADNALGDRLWMQCGTPAAFPIPPQEYFRRQLFDFSGAISTGQAPLNDGVSHLPAIRLIEQCYALRQPMPEPWNGGGAL